MSVVYLCGVSVSSLGGESLDMKTAVPTSTVAFGADLKPLGLVQPG